MESNELGLLGIKAEVTYGTDPVPTTSANLIPVERGSISYVVNSTPIERRALDGGLLPLLGFNSLPNVELKFRYEVRGNRTNGIAADISSGSVSNKVEIDALLKACNLDPTYTAESGGGRNGYVQYAPAAKTTVGDSVTCYWWSALKLHKLIGGKATFNLILEAGKIPVMEFTVRGKYSAVTDVALPNSSLTWLDTKPQVWEGGVSLWGGSHYPVHTRLSVDLGNEIVMRSDPNQSDGVAGFVITDTNPKGSFDPESVAEATNPFWADWRAATLKSFFAELKTGSTYTGNQFRVSCTAETKSLNYQNRDKLRAHDLQFNIVKQQLSTAANAALIFQFS